MDKAALVIKKMKKNYRLVTSKSMKSWQAWVIIGIVAGGAGILALISSNEGEFLAGRAAKRKSGDTQAVLKVTIPPCDSKKADQKLMEAESAAKKKDISRTLQSLKEALTFLQKCPDMKK